MNALPIKTWINDTNDKELEIAMDVLEHLAKVDDIPKVVSELKIRKLKLDARNINKLIEDDFVATNRGAFNSPVHLNRKSFQFTPNGK